MPPRARSRHLYTLAFRNTNDQDDPLLLTDRVRFFFRDLPDNVQHRVTEGDTLFNLAQRYYASVERAAGLWWVIADFQPDPIHDPTLMLEPGEIIVVPSLRTVLSDLFNPNRSDILAY